MFAIPGLTALILLIILRPQEYYTFLAKAPLLYLFCVAAVGGYVIDQKLRLLQPVVSRTLVLALTLWGWSIVTIVLKVPGTLQIAHIIKFTIVLVVYFVLCQGVQSFRALRVIAGALMSAFLFLAVVGVHQASAPQGCVMVENKHLGIGEPDGRPCEDEFECLGIDAEPGALYTCQRIGLWGTTALDGRVRYRGEIQDPNEMALAVCAGLPFLIAFAARKKRLRWRLATVGGGILIFQAVLGTQSRGGMLVFMAVLAVYFIRRYGFKYAMIGVLAMLPVMMLSGGRSDAAADKSTQERYEAWRHGLIMFRGDPVFGVGQGMFPHIHYLTAHNSYVLASAELGFIGMFLWMSILYLTIKVPIQVLRDFPDDPAAEPARVWGMAVLGVAAAFLVQMMFLSLTYHTLTWILFGFSGAYYSTVKRHNPDWEVSFTRKDMAIICVICITFLIVLDPFLRTKGF